MEIFCYSSSVPLCSFTLCLPHSESSGVSRGNALGECLVILWWHLAKSEAIFFFNKANFFLGISFSCYSPINSILFCSWWWPGHKLLRPFLGCFALYEYLRSVPQGFFCLGKLFTGLPYLHRDISHCLPAFFLSNSSVPLSFLFKWFLLEMLCTLPTS